MIDTVALDPAYSPLGEPVTAMVTGKEATLALLEAAISPIDDTVPYTGVLDPLGVMTAWSPAWIWPTSVSSTVVLTVKEPVDTTTMSLLLPEDDDELEVDDDEPRALAAAPRPLSPEDVEQSSTPVPPEPDAAGSRAARHLFTGGEVDGCHRSAEGGGEVGVGQVGLGGGQLRGGGRDRGLIGVDLAGGRGVGLIGGQLGLIR